VASSGAPQAGTSIDIPGHDPVSQQSLASSEAVLAWTSFAPPGLERVSQQSLVSSEAAQAGTSCNVPWRDPVSQASCKGVHEFTIRLDKRPYGASLGAQIDWMDDATLQVERITKQGLVWNWNLKNHKKPVKTADQIVEVNSCRGRASVLMAELMKHQILKIVIRRIDVSSNSSEYVV